MKISRRSRQLHDPWGNKNGNRFGSPIRFQFMVGLGTSGFNHEVPNVHRYESYIDRVSAIESTRNKVVMTGKCAVEKLRR
jgi:hypothetical protein